ncbi:MAG: hypothetical protein R2873_19070 [Caldilineaceae bacterium]
MIQSAPSPWLPTTTPAHSLDYTLTVENAVLVDGSGEQVTDPSAPVTAATEAAEETEAEAAETPAATAAATTCSGHGNRRRHGDPCPRPLRPRASSKPRNSKVN